MKTTLAFLALMGLALAAPAQEAQAVAAERARINAERAAAESAFQTEEKACYGKFAVNDCLKAAKAKRRGVVADLRRQEVALNDMERRRKATERLREVEQRAAEPQKPARVPQAAADAASHAVRPAKPPPRETPEIRTAKQVDEAQRAENAARSRAQHQERLDQAQERKAKLEKRLANRKKPAAQPLPAQP